MRDFWRYLGGTVTHPTHAFFKLTKDKRKLTHGISAMLLISLLYTFTVAGLAAVRAKIFLPPWTAIPADNYYFWEIFFAAPVFILGWVLAGGLVQLLSKLFHGRGTFESTAAALGFAIALPSFITWLPETTGTVLFVTGVMSQQEWIEISSRPGFLKLFADVYQFIALASYLILISAAIKVAQKLRWWQSALLGVITTCIVGLLMVTFIR